MKNKVGLILYRYIWSWILKSLRHTIIVQLRCKNKKLHNLITSKSKKLDSYKIPVINLSTENLDTAPLRYGLHHSYVDENKNVQRNAATELESLLINLDKYINPSSKENFHEYLRAAANVITKNICNDRDNTFKSHTNLRKNETFIVLSADKESCTLILNKTDFVNKVNKVTDEGIASGKYVETSDTTHADLKHFQDFL